MTETEQLRADYETRGLRRNELAENPFAQFDLWYQEAIDRCPGRWVEPNAMTLSTCDTRSGLVTSRTVLLKIHDQDGLVFFTNYQSEKAQQLDSNPQAALLFHWAYLGRQIRISGTVAKTNKEISETYFHSRSRNSQLGALASDQSQRLESREQLENLFRKLQKKYDGQPVPLPRDWGGFRLTPSRFEFWQGRQDRLHDRFCYERAEDVANWTISRLFP